MSPTLHKENPLIGIIVRHAKVIWGIYWVSLFALMHTPKLPTPPMPVSHIDKVFHAVSYAILAALGATVALRAGTRLTRGWYLKWIVVYTAYGGVDELLQPFVNRTAEWYDWAADVAGVLIAMTIVYRKTRGQSQTSGS